MSAELLDKNPAVAVLISVYRNDSPLFFEEALNSLFTQYYGAQKIHVYLAIDGEISQEITDIIEKKSNKFYKIRRISPNSGLANALNVLIDSLEDEEYVFRMDSDDISRKDRIQKQVEFMQNNPEIGICGTAIEEFTEDGSRNIRQYPISHEKILAKIHKASPFAHPSVCFRKSALLKLQKYSVKSHLCEDAELWFRAIKKGITAANLSDVCLDFRIQNNLYKRRGTAIFDEFRVRFGGVYGIFGINIKLLFPVARLFFRLMPQFIIKRIYASSFRKKFLNG